jgi:hypothetical protein
VRERKAENGHEKKASVEQSSSAGAFLYKKQPQRKTKTCTADTGAADSALPLKECLYRRFRRLRQAAARKG